MLAPAHLQLAGCGCWPTAKSALCRGTRLGSLSAALDRVTFGLTYPRGPGGGNVNDQYSLLPKVNPLILRPPPSNIGASRNWEPTTSRGGELIPPRSASKTRTIRNILPQRSDNETHNTEGASMRDGILFGENGAECNHDGSWRKSSYSMSNGQCIEIARLVGGHVGVRDSKTVHGSVLRFEPRAWVAFTTELRASPPV
jgi:Domain of unknown function (DUF397)